MTRIEVTKIVPYQNNMKHTRYGAYPTQNLKNYQQEIKKQLTNADTTLFKEVKKLELNIYFVFKIPKSWNKAKKEEFKGRSHNIKPDLDNLPKPIIDVIADFYGFDDEKISRIVLEKEYNNDINEKNNIIFFDLKPIK